MCSAETSGTKSTIYRTRVKHATHYAIDVVWTVYVFQDTHKICSLSLDIDKTIAQGFNIQGFLSISSLFVHTFFVHFMQSKI